VIAKNSQSILIKDVLTKKCSYYYEFEKLLEDSSITTSSFVIEFTRSDSKDSRKDKEMRTTIEETKTRNNTQKTNEKMIETEYET
jgi:hypothetical protein